MLIRRILVWFVVLCAGIGLQAHSQAGREHDLTALTAPLAVRHATQVPGKLLKPGAYTIRVVDHLTDRVILQVEDAQGRPLSTFLGLGASDLHASNGREGPVSWPNGPNDTDTLRGYSFPGGSMVEFVYPKEDAVAIAKLNTAKVAAVDPASEHKVAAKHLSADDLETITLWTLSSTRVGPEASSQAAITATRYQPPTPVAAPRSATHDSSVGATKQQAGGYSSTPGAQRPALVASLKRPNPTGLTALPHTASFFPLLGLAAVAMVLAGLALHSLRLMTRG